MGKYQYKVLSPKIRPWLPHFLIANSFFKKNVLASRHSDRKFDLGPQGTPRDTKGPQGTPRDIQDKATHSNKSLVKQNES